MRGARKPPPTPLKQMRNYVGDLFQAIGEKLLPVMRKVVPKVIDVTMAIIGWIERNPTLAKWIVIVVGAIGALAFVLGGTLIAVSAMLPALGLLAASVKLVAFLKGLWASQTLVLHAQLLALTIQEYAQAAAIKAKAIAMKLAAVATKAVTVAQWLLNAAMTANPIGLVIVAIGALIAIGVLLWKNWDTISAKAQEIWGIVKYWLGRLVDHVKELPGKVWEAIKEIPQLFSDAFEKAYDWVEFWDGGKMTEHVKEFPNAVKDALVPIPGHFKSAFEAASQYTATELTNMGHNVSELTGRILTDSIRWEEAMRLSHKMTHGARTRGLP